MRNALLAAFYVALAVAGAALLYLLFMLGHTETASLGHTLAAALIAGAGALVAGLLQWVGLPAKEEDAPEKK